MTLSGNIFDYFIAFWGGVLVSFSPCLYPVLPITAGFIAGANVQGTKVRALIISLVYVLGLAITYCALGIFAALSGKIFGQFQNQPAFFFVTGNILILFSLVMFDVIPFFSFGAGASSRFVLKNLWAVLLFGMVSGFVVGPCTTPVLGTLLLYVASKQNIFYAMSLLFAFSCGVGSLLVLVGTFSGLLSRLPKSGIWLVRVRQICAILLLVMGEYFLIKGGRLLE